MVLYENLRNNNLLTDIGNINYCDGEHKLDKLTPITDIFCDNIMLVKIADFKDCEGDIRNDLKLIRPYLEYIIAIYEVSLINSPWPNMGF